MKTANTLSLPRLIFTEIKSIKKTNIKRLMFVFLSAILIIVPIVMVNRIYQVPFYKLTSAPIALAGIHPLSGVLSNLGIVLWCAAECSCAFAAIVLRTLGEKNIYLFLLYSFWLSAYLLFDDLFQFHEDLSTTIGLDQKIIYILLGTAVATYFIYFRKILLQTNFIPFLMALAFLGLSILSDSLIYEIFGSQLGDWQYLIENGAKWIGIVFWCYYFISTSFQFIMKNMANTIN